MLLSTAVFPEQGKSFGDKKQDFNTWLSRGYLDIITPMAYYDDIPTLKRALEGMLPGLAACYCYAGISPTYHNLPDQQVLNQMQTAAETGADGFVFFGSQSILNNPGYIELLDETLPGQTILPHAGAKTLIDATMQNVEKKLTAGGEPAQKIQELLQELEKIGQMVDDTDHEKMEQACKQLRLLTKYNLATYVTEENLNAVKPELEHLFRWISVKTTRLQAKFDRPADEDPPETPEQPSETPEQETVPTQPTETQPGGNEHSEKQSNLARNLGLGAAIAAVRAAVAAGFHAIRKGRKKQ